MTVPDGLSAVLDAVRGAFGAPSFATFNQLVTGMLGAVGEHSVTGMWIAAGLAGRSHWARGHRFFSHARWNPDTLGLLLARLVVALFAPEGALTVVVDDTLFERCGKGAAWESITVTVYGKTKTVQCAVIDCLWFGSMHTVNVRVVLTRALESGKLYDLALVSTDLAATADILITRYSWRWSIEQSIKDCKILLGAGQARNRLQAAVARTVPFGMLCLTILFCWYHQTGIATSITARRSERPWYPRKTQISVEDMLIAFRRARINAISPGHTPSSQIPDTAPTSALAAT